MSHPDALAAVMGVCSAQIADGDVPEAYVAAAKPA
jgi:hypothetical protein